MKKYTIRLYRHHDLDLILLYKTKYFNFRKALEIAIRNYICNSDTKIAYPTFSLDLAEADFKSVYKIVWNLDENKHSDIINFIESTKDRCKNGMLRNILRQSFIGSNIAHYSVDASNIEIANIKNRKIASIYPNTVAAPLTKTGERVLNTKSEKVTKRKNTINKKDSNKAKNIEKKESDKKIALNTDVNENNNISKNEIAKDKIIKNENKVVENHITPVINDTKDDDSNNNITNLATNNINANSLDILKNLSKEELLNLLSGSNTPLANVTVNQKQSTSSDNQASNKNDSPDFVDVNSFSETIDKNILEEDDEIDDATAELMDFFGGL